MHATDIVAYTYKADIYCPNCIVARLPTGLGGEFDGWALAGGLTMDVEMDLDEIAAAFGIDRQDEYSYDGDYFPKVVFGDADVDDYCGGCHNPIT